MAADPAANVAEALKTEHQTGTQDSSMLYPMLGGGMGPSGYIQWLEASTSESCSCLWEKWDLLGKSEAQYQVCHPSSLSMGVGARTHRLFNMCEHLTLCCTLEVL